MAKKKLADERPQPAVIDTAELAGDGANPREIGPVGGRNFVHGFTASALLFGGA